MNNLSIKRNKFKNFKHFDTLKRLYGIHLYMRGPDILRFLTVSWRGTFERKVPRTETKQLTHLSIMMINLTIKYQFEISKHFNTLERHHGIPLY